MLNISENRILAKQFNNKYSTLNKVENKTAKKGLRRTIIGVVILMVIVLFLPWTQNIRSNGSVTSFSPNQKPQTIHSVIGGKIEEWYVQEGDYIQSGDTIVRLSETKDDYFDPNLLSNVDDRISLKQKAIKAYDEKLDALKSQSLVTKEQKNIKINQAKIKLKQLILSAKKDSMGYVSALNNYKTSVLQFNRMDSLFQLGLKSLTDLENRNIKMQKAMAYEVEMQIKWLNAKNSVNQGEMEIPNISVKYDSQLYKIQSELLTVQSTKLDAETELNKLKNSYNNYEFRNSLYYVIAPINGFLSQALQEGIGKTLKPGDPIVKLMPENVDLAVEMFIDPIDYPLVTKGEHVRIQFDGWPAIVFSGWPMASYGTYGGTITAIDRHINENGKFRILVTKDKKDHDWPELIRYGSGTSNMILLGDVPIWYELWRKINGFPADFYKNKKSTSKTKNDGNNK